MSLLHGASFSIVSRLLIKGYCKPLTFDDMYGVLEEDACKSVVVKFDKEWHQQTGGKTSRKMYVLKLGFQD